MAITSRDITLGEKRKSRKTSYHSLNGITPYKDCFFVFSGNKKLVVVGKRPQWGRIFEVTIYEESEGDT